MKYEELRSALYNSFNRGVDASLKAAGTEWIKLPFKQQETIHMNRDQYVDNVVKELFKTRGRI